MNNNAKIIRFNININAPIEAYSVKPIFDDTGLKLLGGFVLRHDQTVSCFVTASDPPYNLFFSSNMPFYFTPQFGNNGLIESALLSECPLNNLSIRYEWEKL